MLINRQELLLFYFGLKSKYKEYNLKLQIYNNYIISACKNTCFLEKISQVSV